MGDREKIDQQVHDLVDEANVLLLEFALPGAKDAGRVTRLIARIRDCAVRAHEFGRVKSAQHLREVIIMLEKESTKTTS